MSATSTTAFFTPSPITWNPNGVVNIPVIVGAPPRYSAMPFAWHVSILLICLFGVFVLTTLPRAIARASVGSERTKGYLLRRGRVTIAPLSTAGARADSDARSIASGETVVDANPAPSEETHTLDSHTMLVMPKKQGSLRPARIPTRVPSWLALMHPRVVYLLNYQIVPGTAVAHMAVLLVWFGITMYLGTRGTSPFTAPRRPADIAVAQLPIVIALATKNSLPAVLAGFGYEKVRHVSFHDGCRLRDLRSSTTFTALVGVSLCSLSTCTPSITVRHLILSWTVRVLNGIKCTAGPWTAQLLSKRGRASSFGALSVLLPATFSSSAPSNGSASDFTESSL